jgi:hypothetical protein
MSPAVLRERFGAIEDVVAVTTAIFVCRHAALRFCIAQAGFPDSTCSAGSDKSQASLMDRRRPSAN